MHVALTRAQRRRRRLWRWVKAVVALALISMALVLAMTAVAMPWIVSHPEKVQAFLAERLGRPVAFDSLEGTWTRTGPLFKLSQVQVGDRADGEPFRIDSAELAVDFYAWMRSGVSFVEFRVVGLQIDAERGDDGRWRIARLGQGGTESVSGVDTLLGLTAVSISNARVRLSDPQRGLNLSLVRIDLRVANDFGTRRLGGAAWQAIDQPAVRFACSTDRAGNRCWIGAREMSAATWFQDQSWHGVSALSGTLDLDLWIAFDARLDDVRFEIAARDLVLRGETAIEFSDGIKIEPREFLPWIRIAGKFARDGDGWSAHWHDWRDPTHTQPTTRIAVARTDATAPVAVRAARIDLAAVAPLLALSELPPPALRRVLYENAPAGNLFDVALDIDALGQSNGRVRLDGVRLIAGSRAPGVNRLSGSLEAINGVFVFEPDAGLQVSIDLPHVFRESIAVRIDAGTFGIWRDDQGLSVEGSGLVFEGSGYVGRGRALLRFDGTGVRPFVDAAVSIERGQISRARQFWPVNVMPAPAVAWLDRALTSGSVELADALVFGDLDDWPFVENSGRFEARARVRDLDLDYHPRWPRGLIESADAEFSATGMVVNSDAVSSMGSQVSLGHARIESFKSPVLQIHIEGEGSGANLLDFVRASPVLRATGGYLSGIGVGGSGRVAFDLDLPLGKAPGVPRLFGSVLLTDADLTDHQWRLAFAQANGRLRFTEKGFAADDLAVRIDGDPASLSISVGEFTSDAEHLVEASLRGDLPLRTVLSGVAGMEPLLERMPGRSEWALELLVGRGDKSGEAGVKRVSLSSDLRGTALDLPAPLRKDADSALPVRMQIGLPVQGAQLDLELGRMLRLRARLPDNTNPFAGTLAFGVAELGELPSSGLRVRGDMPAADLGGWVSAAAGGAATPFALDLDVTTAELAVLGRAFSQTRVALNRGDGPTRLSFEGEQVQGTITLPAVVDESKGVRAEFERLFLPEATPTAPVRGIDPAALPALHLWVKDLRLGAAQLGEARVETYPLANGLRVEQLDTSSPVIALRARGEWTLDQGVERSQFSVTFTAENLGQMLDALGFAGVVDGGQTMAQLDGEWAGSPAQFGLARIAGTLQARIGQGRILEVNPGAGRLLGLVSLQAIPRRLALDFSDFFRSGMAFDSIEGQFELRTGDAFTTDLVVKGPSAVIAISGRTGLSARDYDQELEVTPKVGGVLPVVGAIAGGPVGAAAGLLAQGMLQAPLNQMTRARYRVSGSWDKPQIDLIARERGPATPRESERRG